MNQLFTWLRDEKDNRFGEKCEVVRILGDKLTYRFTEREWSMETAPLNWFLEQKQYSDEEISAIRKKQKSLRYKMARY